MKRITITLSENQVSTARRYARITNRTNKANGDDHRITWRNAVDEMLSQGEGAIAELAGELERDISPIDTERGI